MLSLPEKYIVDEKGEKTAIVLPYAAWEKIVEILEDYDALCYDKVKARRSDLMPIVN